MSKIVVVGEDVKEVRGRFEAGRPLVTEGDLPVVVGWSLRTEGLCRGDVCVPVQDPATLRAGVGEVDLAAVAAALDVPCVVDAAAGFVALALGGERRRQALADLTAPDFSLPDLEGNVHGLGEWRGRKKLLVTFASWCGCRYDLPGWQALYEELVPDGFTTVAVAVDNAPEDVRPWVEGVTFPVLLDANHVLSELYAMSNVPTVVWIDEDDRIVRPNELAFGTDTFRDFTKVASGPHLEAVRRWVRDGEVPLSAEEARGAVADLSDQEVMARLHFRIGAAALRRGAGDVARRHLAEASTLAPYDWTVRRAAMPLLGEDPFGQDFLDLYEEWRQLGSPYHGLPVAIEEA